MAAVGLLFGAGMYGPGAVLTCLILVVLIGLRAVESLLPHKVYALATFVFESDHTPDQSALEALLGPRDFRLYDVSYAWRADGKRFQYTANLVTRSELSLQSLPLRLKDTAGLVEFNALHHRRPVAPLHGRHQRFGGARQRPPVRDRPAQQG